MRDFIVDHPRGALFVPMGFGKSSATLAAIDTMLIASMINRVLVIAPLRVARSTWPEEIRQWAQFAHLSVATVTGTAAERRAALARKAVVTTVNYEQGTSVSVALSS